LANSLSLEELNERILKHGEIIADGKTVRAAALLTGWSKTTVDTDVAVRLKQIDLELAKKAREVLDRNYSERCVRGGKASQKNGCNFLHKNGKAAV
jgi:putative DeoR family transcriptional regulator (stage III sporulation protein D)